MGVSRRCPEDWDTSLYHFGARTTLSLILAISPQGNRRSAAPRHCSSLLPAPPFWRRFLRKYSRADVFHIKPRRHCKKLLAHFMVVLVHMCVIFVVYSSNGLRWPPMFFLC